MATLYRIHFKVSARSKEQSWDRFGDNEVQVRETTSGALSREYGDKAKITHVEISPVKTTITHEV